MSAIAINIKKFIHTLKIAVDTVFKKIINHKLIKSISDTYIKYNVYFDISIILLYKITLDIIYVTIVYPYFEYMGFSIDFSILRYMISMLTIMVFAIPIIGLYRKKIASSIIITIINFMYFIPLTTLYALYDFDTYFYMLAIIYWSILMVLQYHIPVVSIANIDAKYKKNVFYTIMIVISSVVIFVSYKYTGFRISLDLFNVYDIRSEASNYSMPQIIGYIISVAGASISVFLVYAIQKKKSLLFIILIIISILNYSISTVKSLYMVIFLTLLGYVFYRKNLNKLISVAFLGVNISAIVVYIFNKNILIVDLFIRRVFLVPIKLSYDYYEFFQNNNLNIFRNGFMGKIGFEEIYNDAIAKIMGHNLTNTSISLNNGLLADVFSGIGFVGVIIMPLIIIILLRVLDGVSKNIDHRVIVGVCIYYAYVFTNASWSTTLLSHGFLVVCILIYLYPVNARKE